MLKYVILSTPRCGSSTLMSCAELALGRQSFIREPLNPYEDMRWHPSFLHGKSVAERAALLCDPACPVQGVKHVFSPFNQAMSDDQDVEALVRLLSLPDLKVILLTRGNVFRQFISMEIALQTGDWWSSGAAALPAELGPIKSGSNMALSEDQIAARIDRLERAHQQLRDICALLKIDFVEYAYETLFEGNVEDSLIWVRQALTHFDSQAAQAVPEADLRNLLQQGRRFEAISDIYRRVKERFPALAATWGAS